jgi:starch-binding outer membrane protein, SusD/RagB family
MKKYNLRISITAWIACLLLGTSCVKDLDVVPIDENIVTSATFYDSQEAYKEVLAKIYGGFALTGQTGPNGNQDILGLDEGFTDYIRDYWYMQDMTTEMALWTWTDAGVPELQLNNWTPSNAIVLGMYSRIYYEITLVNEFVRESTDAKLSGKGFNESTINEIKLYRAEARLVRALCYYHALDLFGSVPFVTENDKVGNFLPKQISKADLFNYIETELKDLETLLADPGTNVYGRIDKAAAWMILAKLYLNAKVYIGQEKYTETITYCKKLMNSSYKLDPNYDQLFMADNNTSPEIIFPIVQDGVNTQTWGGTTFIGCASWTADMNNTAVGINNWGGGLRARKQLIDKFADPSGNTDKRAMFFMTDRTITTDQVSTFKNGYSVMKYKNITSAGVLGSSITHLDIDFPLFRLADAYLMLAEAQLRGGSGATAQEALDAVNAIRERAYGGTSGNITLPNLTLAFILDERAREFYWEGSRRTDLVRFDKFTSGDYLWEWKGGLFGGKSLDSKYNHFPIPASDRVANPSLEDPDYD